MFTNVIHAFLKTLLTWLIVHKKKQDRGQTAENGELLQQILNNTYTQPEHTYSIYSTWALQQHILKLSITSLYKVLNLSITAVNTQPEHNQSIYCTQPEHYSSKYSNWVLTRHILITQPEHCHITHSTWALQQQLLNLSNTRVYTTQPEHYCSKI